MQRNLVQEVHNAAAHSPSSAVASVRPAATSGLELAIMRRDVLRKLRPDRSSAVLEVGCGTGMLAMAIAPRVERFVGMDFAEDALAVLRERIEREGLAARARVEAGNFAELEPGRLERFDRVLVYATLHYARSADEGRRFVRNVVAALRPGGRALFGNLPLSELAAQARPLTSGGGARAALAWLRADSRPLHWKAGTLAFLVLKGRVLDRRARRAADVPSLPPGYCVDLSRELVENWIAAAGAPTRHRWLRPAVGSPLSVDRADLIVERDG